MEKPDEAEKVDLPMGGGQVDEIIPLPNEDSSGDTEDWKVLRRCAEAVSLNRVRDAMGTGMEGMMGLLRWVSF